LDIFVTYSNIATEYTEKPLKKKFILIFWWRLGSGLLISPKFGYAAKGLHW